MKKNNDIWILAEGAGERISGVSHELLNRALPLAAATSGRIRAVILGEAFSDETLQKLIEHGADSVIAVEHPALKYFSTDLYARCLCDVIARFQPPALIAGATLTGRTLMPYAAMICGTGLTADCTLLELDPATGLLTQTRPAIGGNIMASIQCREKRPQMATVRPHSMRPSEARKERRGEILRIAAPEDLEMRMEQLAFRKEEAGSGIQNAEKLIVVGRGIRKPETLGMIRELATLLGASVGASREVVDRGWLDYPHQIGLSGRTVTPKLYLGIGVSGAIQHLAGMQTAETIVAVNRDPEAPIFRVADFGIRGDLFEVVPAMIRALRKGEAIC